VVKILYLTRKQALQKVDELFEGTVTTTELK
jgi:hypothetical protein